MLTLYELIEGTEKIVFECEAEDIHHAIEQAEVAYPSANIIGAMLMIR